MKEENEELRQRLHFIDRTISHALCACHAEERVPRELWECVQQLGRRSDQACRALLSRDILGVRENIDALARLSQRAQNALYRASGMSYALKSAVILTHIELSALHHRLG